jgi:heptosyltransferase-2
MVGEDILVCGPNWLGDSIMAMPAVQAFKERYPRTNITLLVKESLVPLWRMNPDVFAAIELKKNLRGVFEASRVVKAGCFDEAFVLSHSFRSAVVPFLQRVPLRFGMAGYGRGPLLTHPVKRNKACKPRHMLFEYMDVMGLRAECRVQLPQLVLPHEAISKAWQRLYSSDWIYRHRRSAEKEVLPLVGLVPGAARGISKQWPEHHFAALGQRLARDGNHRVLVLGSPQEQALGDRVAEAIGPEVLNLAGETSIEEFAALLSMCTAVVANDSGGMHLAAAVGVPVAAIFGLTDPAVTGPIGKGHRIIQNGATQKKRSIDRNSSEARNTLESIGPERVLHEVLRFTRSVPIGQ